MEQKKFVKFGLTTENFRRYVGIIRGEVEDYLTTTVFEKDVSYPFLARFVILMPTETRAEHRLRNPLKLTRSLRHPKSPFALRQLPFRVRR